jgi:hypothetical protein
MPPPAFRLRSSPAQRSGSFRNHTLLSRLNLRSNPPNFVAQAYIEHRLPGVLQKVHDLSCRGSQIKMSAVGKKVILRRCADRGGQAGAEFLPQKTNHFAHALKRESPPAKLADDGHRNQFVPAIDSAMPLAAGCHDPSFVPPLQLAGGDSSQGDHFVGCEFSLHLEHILFQTRN